MQIKKVAMGMALGMWGGQGTLQALPLDIKLAPIAVADELKQWHPYRNLLGQDTSQLEFKATPGKYEVGAFIVQISQDRGGVIEIVHRNEPQRLQWSSVAGRPFVYAGRGKDTVFQWRGSFLFKDVNDRLICNRQSVDKVRQDSTGLLIAGQLTGKGCSLTYELKFAAKSEKRLGFDLSFQGASKDLINRSFIRYSSAASERFFGFGEQFTHMDVKGKIVPILVREQGHLRGARQPLSTALNTVSPGSAGTWHTSYISVPQYISSERRGLFLETTEYAQFDFKKQDEVLVRLWKNGMSGQIFYGQNYLDMIAAYTEYAGRAAKVPSWFHEGAIIGLMGGAARVAEMDRKLRAEEMPIAAYWLQDWQGMRVTSMATRMWWNWVLDPVQYPGWNQMVSDFEERGIRTLGYVNPYLSDVSERSGIRNLYREAKELGYLVKTADGSLPYEVDSGEMKGALIDLSNPEARSWYKQIIKENLLGNGMKGWMADFGEALGFDAQLASGKADSFHNAYPEEWARLNREVIEESGLADEAVFFVRSGYTTSPRHASLFWAGDQMTSWDGNDGLKSAIKGMVSGGLSGFAINHSDIGGLIAIKALGGVLNITRSQELFVRWAELSAFTAAYRTHEGINPQLMHQPDSDPYTLAHFAYFAKVFKALAPYREKLFAEASQHGYPVMRHPFIEYGDDPETYHLVYQYMLGHDFLIAPVVDPKMETGKVYLPSGTRWVHLWSGEQFDGGRWIKIAAPWGQIPVFYREDSLYGPALREQVGQLTAPRR
jgi:alpha-glucosidase